MKHPTNFDMYIKDNRSISMGGRSVNRNRKLSDLSCDELCGILDAVHFGRDSEVLRKCDISGRQFALCTDADLTEMGINIVVKRKDALNLAEKWKSEGIPEDLLRKQATPSKVSSCYLVLVCSYKCLFHNSFSINYHRPHPIPSQ